MSTESARKAAERIMFGEMSAALIDFSKYPLTPDQKSKLDQITRIIESSYAAACQTVAPPPVVESKLVSPAKAPDSWAILINGQPIDYDEYEYSAKEKVRKIQHALGAAPAVSTPPQEGQLQHGRNCAALSGPFIGDVDDCSCGLQWRIHLQTEQEMSAAWRKRAEEAEAKVSGTAVSTPRCPSEDGLQVWAARITQVVMSSADYRDRQERQYMENRIVVQLRALTDQFFQPAPSLNNVESGPECPCEHPAPSPPRTQLDMSICSCGHAKAGHISGIGYCTACDCGEFKL